MLYSDLMKNIGNTIKTKHLVFVFLGVLLFLSYTGNLFHVADPHLFHAFERQPEGLAVGRLVKAEVDGVFSEGGLTGINYWQSDSLTESTYASYQAAQHDYYITGKQIPDSFFAYKSQSGGQAIVMSLIAKIIPLPNIYKLMIFRAINALLIVLVFVMFAMWVSRQFGLLPGIVTLVLIGLSPWLTIYSHNLWWVLWNFYLPFLTVLLALEHHYQTKGKPRNLYLFFYVFIAVLFKVFFTGFEFITTSLLAAYVPLVYYAYLHKIKLVAFVSTGFSMGVAMLLGILLQMGILICQIKAYAGTYTSGVEHIIVSFTKRTASEIAKLSDVLYLYLQDDAFALGFLPNNVPFNFGLLFFLIVLFSFLLLKIKRIDAKYRAFIYSFIFSFTAPLSWLIIFKQHAWIHIHMDYIVWYMPTLLYGFALVGICCQHVFKYFRKG